MSSRTLLSLLLVAFVAPACSSSDDPAGPDDAGGTISATVDGAAWSADALAMNNGFLFGVEGTADGIRIALSVNLTEHTLPGTVDLRSGSTGAQIGEGGETWYAVGSGGSGTLTVQTLTAERATGTFSFTGAGVGGSATGTRTIVNGSFDVRF